MRSRCSLSHAARLAEREMDDDSDEYSTPRTTPSTPERRSVSLPPPPLPHSRKTRFDLAPLATLDQRSASPEPLPTPTFAQSYTGLKRNLSFKSLKELEVRELSATLSSHVYRRGSRAERRRYKPRSDDETFTHALKGGIRAFSSFRSLPSTTNLALHRLLHSRLLPPSLRQPRSRLAATHEEAVRSRPFSFLSSPDCPSDPVPRLAGVFLQL